MIRMLIDLWRKLLNHSSSSVTAMRVELKQPSRAVLHCKVVDMMNTFSEADLGMFSMFGRTGAPQKWGPHMRTKKFLVLSCPWKLNYNTKSLPPDAFSVF